jgi:hypothetical protein
MVNYPVLLLFPISLLIQWIAARVGVAMRRRRPLADEDRDEFGFVQTAALTLLALIIGFSFSMAVGRYDQRKNYEEAEANAIGTEYVRAGLLPSAEAVKVQTQLKKYLALRVQFYGARQNELQKINADTVQLQAEMWSAVQAAGLANPTPVMALAVSGMNDVLNSQGYTQAAWWNRIPKAAWGLMVVLALLCNVLIGYGGRSSNAKISSTIVMPLFVAISFLMIADLDSPHGGVIRVAPQNLVSLAESL